MLVFPRQFPGSELARTSLLYVLYEVVFYGFVGFLFHRRTTLMQLVQVSGMCLVYRLGLSAAFGLLVSVFYSMDMGVAMTLAMASYVEGLVLQILAAPFILKPVIDQLYVTERKLVSPLRSAGSTEGSESGRTSIVISRDRGLVHDVRDTAVPHESTPAVTDSAPVDELAAPHLNNDLNGFERAVRYIGEHGSVKLAVVVDDEGLMLSHFRRGNIDPEEWAPMALLFLQNSQQVLDRQNWGATERLDLRLPDMRISVARDEGFSLLVVSERQSDDVLSIRIRQARELIKKYVAERYGSLLDQNAERIHVSSAE